MLHKSMSFRRIPYSIMLIAVSSCFIDSHVAPCQEPSAKDGVLAALNEIQAGLYTGFASKTLSRAGDSAATYVFQHYSLAEIRQERTARAVVGLISMSFSNPTMIDAEADKTPKMSMLVLTYLKVNAIDAEEVKAISIAETELDMQVRRIEHKTH